MKFIPKKFIHTILKFSIKGYQFVIPKINLLSLSAILVTLIFSTACQSNESESTSQPTINTDSNSPDILVEEVRDYGGSWKSGRYKTDIIDKLYSEALKKDKALKKLQTRINKFPDLRQDSLQAYFDYDNNNQEYFNASKNYIKQIKDSSTQKQITFLFESMENNYRKNMITHQSSLKAINQRIDDLNDQVILMQLLVTKSMINNYQTNELPSVNTLNRLKESQDQLINEIESFNKSLQ